jgi:very-short-patch-repair endonuclease
MSEKKTFESHSRAKYWSPKNTGLPADYSLNSHKKCWFDCDCGHVFEMILRNINSRNSWCPYCVNPNKKLCENLECEQCFEKSFASHEKAKYWSNENVLNSRQVANKTHKKCWFDCSCGHNFEAILSDITQNNSWCPYCSKPSKRLCGNKECVLCLNKTFAPNKRAKFWSKKNTLLPNQVFKSSAVKYWFNCDKCSNEFESKLCHITDGSWCPKCRYKTEDKLHNILKEIYPTIESQFKVDWCKNKKHLPFDIVLLEEKIIVEVDGDSHFIQVAKWKTPEHNRSRDIYKRQCANENGFSIIRLLQPDVLNDKYDWLQELTNNINKIVLEKKVQNIYMCKNDEYKDFDIML